MMMYFRFERRTPMPVEYRTLADLPEGVECICVIPSGYRALSIRSEACAYSPAKTDGSRGQYFGQAEMCIITQVLDPIPVPTLPKTLADVEEGRCMMMAGHVGNHFRYGNMLLCHVPENGLIERAGANSFDSLQSLTDIYAVACEVGP